MSVSKLERDTGNTKAAPLAPASYDPSSPQGTEMTHTSGMEGLALLLLSRFLISWITARFQVHALATALNYLPQRLL